MDYVYFVKIFLAFVVKINNAKILSVNFDPLIPK